MLIFDFSRVCLPVFFYSGTCAGPMSLGGDGHVLTLAVGAGRCYVCGAGEPAQQGVLADSGGIAAGPGPLRVTPDGAVKITAVGIAGQAAKYLGVPDGGAAVFLRGACPEAASLLEQLYAGKGKAAAHRQSALAYQMLCSLAAAGPAKGLPAVVLAAADEMRERYGEVYGVEELAESLGISKCHLVRSFTAAMGIPPGRYLNLVRIENAKRLLAQGQHSVAAVAAMCGYSGANYLCKVFRAHTGESPLSWARRNSHTLPRPGGGQNGQIYL